MAQSMIYQWLAKIGRFIEFTELRLMLKYGLKAYQPIAFEWNLNVPTDRDARATRQKWELIRNHLPAHSFSALDIGCNIGFFSFKLVQEGAGLVFGLDVERGPLLIADKIKQLSRIQNVGFCQYKLSPENVCLIGQFDIILFLSVFHHLNYVYGYENAKLILSELIKNTRKTLFFETGLSDQGYGKMALAMPEMSGEGNEKFTRELLFSCGAGRVDLLGTTMVKNGLKGQRHLFAVSK
jgi:SAM-dependent methyltransferase